MINAELLAKIKAEIERRIEAIAKAPSDNGVMDSMLCKAINQIRRRTN